jgi:hypothetical protein
MTAAERADVIFMNVLLFFFSFAIASFPIFIAVWMDRPHFIAAFRVESYKVALREILYLSFAVSAFAILESLNASLGGHSLSRPERVAVVMITFGFIVIIAFSMIRYGRIAAKSIDELRTEASSQVWLSGAAALFSAIAAGFLKMVGG